jgi:hypothetical protein
VRELALNLTATAVVVLCGVAGCEPAATDGTSTTCTTDVVTVDYGTSTTCDVVPPTRLDVVYPLDMDVSAITLDCQDSGGTLLLTTYPYRCERVNY